MYDAGRCYARCRPDRAGSTEPRRPRVALRAGVGLLGGWCQTAPVAWRAAGPVRFVARRLNTSSIRPPRASRPGLLAPPGLGPPFNTSLLVHRYGLLTRGR